MENTFLSRNRSNREKRESGFYSYIISLAVMVVLPVHHQYLPPLMIAWLIAWTFENYSGIKRLSSSPYIMRSLFIIFIVYYIFQLIGLAYSTDVKMGLSNSFGRLSLVLFPLVLFAPGEMIRNNVKDLLKTFSISTLIFLLFSFIYAAYRSISFADGTLVFNPHPPEFFYLSYFYGNDLTLSQHPSYVAMYVILSAFIAFEAWFDVTLRIKMRLFWLVIALLLLTSLYFLSSRAGILAALILIPVYFFMKLKHNKLVFIIIMGLMILSLPLLLKNQRVKYLYDKMMDKETVGENVEEPRLIIWKSASKLIKENFIFGVGIGDVRKELTREYEKKGKTDMAESRLNAHNQFLEVFLENGITGLILFLTLFVLIFRAALIKRNILYGLFILLLVLFFMFETILYRLAGITFFSIFSFLLFYYESPKARKG